ncbi:radical SAM family heme chaperone HemW [Pseudoruegeria sp. SHC-113]|uniref:radical SAM family heme chaperone HemW n=1 Tax=Pseudoruegeria sp. SHC-113 TaxID=2855439 RepID=UPI0021BAD05E|nr:radical SAM family heme chaperone HemW [Pseudoruegeria sp. SHC-113]MCT8158572.1 radical SAM family heme chaperone HemW [Pseudoruegeria sp. SHC-113]
MSEDWQNAGFGLYIHWPFCQSLCPYCDFNSYVSSKIDQRQWQGAYIREIKRIAAETGPRVLGTVFFGGGTPSLMAPETVHAILDAVRAAWPMANDAEITLEANPGSVEAGRFRGYRDAGVNRVSMGVQALNDADLKRLGRLHSVAEARAAFDVARSAFDRVSFDLIYARQHQSVAAWEAELCEALAMAIDHLSLYQLTIEQGTAFGDRYEAGKLSGLPLEDDAAEMYERTQEICEAAGMPAYEISNHARTGEESRHNSLYWRYGDYAGIGPGAHGRLTLNGRRLATETYLQPGKWLEAEGTAGSGESLREEITQQDQAVEYLLMGLRLVEGIDLPRLEGLSSTAINMNKFNSLMEHGLLETADNRLRVTPKGRPLLNAVLRELLSEA